VDSSNTLIKDLVSPLNEMVRVINAVSNGDLSPTVPVEIDGKLGRPSRGQMRGRHLERPHRERERQGGQPHQPSAQQRHPGDA